MTDLNELLAKARAKINDYHVDVPGTRSHLLKSLIGAVESLLNAPVPNGYVLVPNTLTFDGECMESLMFVLGGAGDEEKDYFDGEIHIGELTNDDGAKVFGLHVGNLECLEEGYTTIATFDPFNVRPAVFENVPTETKAYTVGTVATGPGPLPELSPAQQESA